MDNELKHRTLQRLVFAVAGYCLAVAALRRWYLRWGATDEEIQKALPGDALMHRASSHHAITIDAPPEAVWPWLLQIGQDRGGFYSYTSLENLILAGMKNANTIHPEWQSLKPGDYVRLASRTVYGDLPLLRVAAVERNRYLVLDSWGSFVLDPIGHLQTRLLVRSHEDAKRPAGKILSILALEPAHFIMERKMLLGIKKRAERAYGTGMRRQFESAPASITSRTV